MNRITLSANYLVGSNATSQQFASINKGLKRANVLWRYGPKITPADNATLISRCHMYSDVVEANYIDSQNFEMMLRQTKELFLESDSLNPLPALFFTNMFTDTIRRRYLEDGELQIPYRSPVTVFTDTFTPYGLLVDRVMTTNKMMDTKDVIVRGHTNEVADGMLSIPLQQTYFYNRLFTSASGQLPVYYVIGPYNDILRGDDIGDGPIERRLNLTTVSRKRAIGTMFSPDTTVVVDHALCGCYYIGHEGETEYGVLQHIKDVCVEMSTTGPHLSLQHKEIACIRLGYAIAGHEPVITDESVNIKFYNVNIGQWATKVFFESDNDYPSLAEGLRQGDTRPPILDFNGNGDQELHPPSPPHGNDSDSDASGGNMNSGVGSSGGGGGGGGGGGNMNSGVGSSGDGSDSGRDDEGDDNVENEDEEQQQEQNITGDENFMEGENGAESMESAATVQSPRSKVSVDRENDNATSKEEGATGPPPTEKYNYTVCDHMEDRPVKREDPVKKKRKASTTRISLPLTANPHKKREISPSFSNTNRRDPRGILG